MYSKEAMNTVVSTNELEVLAEHFRNRFYQGMMHEEFKSGIRPCVCVMPDSDYAALKLLARKECTFTDRRIGETSMKGSITFIGVDCFGSSMIQKMVFGYRHEN